MYYVDNLNIEIILTGILTEIGSKVNVFSANIKPYFREIL